MMRVSSRKPRPGTSQCEQQLQQLNCTLDWMQRSRCQRLCSIVAKLEGSAGKILPGRDCDASLTHHQIPANPRE